MSAAIRFQNQDFSLPIIEVIGSDVEKITKNLKKKVTLNEANTQLIPCILKFENGVAEPTFIAQVVEVLRQFDLLAIGIQTENKSLEEQAFYAGLAVFNDAYSVSHLMDSEANQSEHGSEGDDQVDSGTEFDFADISDTSESLPELSLADQFAPEVSLSEMPIEDNILPEVLLSNSKGNNSPMPEVSFADDPIPDDPIDPLADIFTTSEVGLSDSNVPDHSLSEVPLPERGNEQDDIDPSAIVGQQVHDGNVNEGEQVYAKGCDLVVRGDVMPGAEVVADGNIIVEGRLRGKAYAGNSGEFNTEELCVRSFCFEPELYSISGCYQLFEDIPNEYHGLPLKVKFTSNTMKYIVG